jgi:hypothetical protein
MLAPPGKNTPRKAGIIRRSAMATCKECENEVESLVSVKVEGKAKKMCEDCADRVRETAEIAEESESVVQNMMGFKGRR